MTAKHFKNTFSYKLVFLAAAIAIAIIAAFSICATSQAKAEDLNADPQGKLVDKAGGKLTPGYGAISDPASGEPVYSNSGTFNSSAYDVIKMYFGEIESIDVGYVSGTSPDGKYVCNLIFKIKAELKDKYVTEGFLNFQFYPSDNILDCCGGIDGKKSLHNLPLDENGTSLDANEYTFELYDNEVVPGINISGQVWDNETGMPAPGKFVQYRQWDPIWGYVPVFAEGTSTGSGFGGEYTLEGITEEMLPGKVFVYDGIKKIGESEPIWFFPEDMETLYMWPIVINQEQPDPPVPPAPPDPPVPPGPNPPEPVPPVPPRPVPTPDNSGGGIAQTGDATPFAAVALLAIMAALGCGIAVSKEF